MHVRARRRARTDAATLGRQFATLLAPLIAIGPDDLDAGLALFEGDERLGAFDAVLAASAPARGAEALISADAGFVGLPGLPLLALGTPDLAMRVA